MVGAAGDPGVPAPGAALAQAVPATDGQRAGTLPALELPCAFVDGMVRHARAFVPQECCGLIAAAADGRAVKRYELRNVDPSVLRYNADPKDLLAAMKDMWDHDWELLAIYHSHTHTPAYPSATDRRLAFYPDAFYVIVSLQEPDLPRVRAFRIVDGAVTEHDVIVTSDEWSENASH